MSRSSWPLSFGPCKQGTEAGGQQLRGSGRQKAERTSELPPPWTGTTKKLFPPPFGRPVARAAWAHGRRLRLSELTPRASAVAGHRQSILCLRCSITVRARLLSTRPPPPPPSREGAEADDASEPLPSMVESRRGALDRKFSHVMDNLQARVLTASHTLNDITGYSSIEAIKADNESLEAQVAAAQARVRTARQAYKTSNTKRATTQREVTTLLARKDSWSPSDLERFTELYRTDHVLEGEVVAAQESLTEAEAEEQSLSQRLSAGILKRYHEEQIWSDRIRRASTWGTWGLMGMNFVLFVALQFVAEPWRRKRLVKGVVEQEQAVLQEVRSELEAVKLGLERMAEDGPELRQATAPEPAHAEQAALPSATLPPAETTWKEVLLDPTRWRTVAADLYSERRVNLRMRDASIIAAEGALAGAAFAGGLALVLLRRT
ncbi:she9 / mdm33 family domain-containing protein [Hirsutella rhossiliensis]|uniref:Sensitive to high expression protein 9, mitochondrial n=1 Tax=Hirsutella rhossiliensis TaxID=111463 RepID=A0A9P8N1K6_9HYPO|nr:she9 / mdm33 family domain-containing protein [Hirsutella rhossiliensis]KAH0966518.1 she9 / mdm33 family domain-containing protein [Hirsutella rhossiliensis]